MFSGVATMAAAAGMFLLSTAVRSVWSTPTAPGSPARVPRNRATPPNSLRVIAIILFLYEKYRKVRLREPDDLLALRPTLPFPLSPVLFHTQRLCLTLCGGSAFSFHG